MKPQLFYQISDPDGAVARRAIMDAGLLDQVQFRNVHYAEVTADLIAHHRAAGRQGEPTLLAWWDGETLLEGRVAVLAAIAAMPRAATP